MLTRTLKEVRESLDNILDEATKEVVQIRRPHKPAAAMMSWELYESLLETLEILSDPDTMLQFQQGVADIDAGRLHDWEAVKQRILANR